MKNFFNYLRLPTFSDNDSLRSALKNVPNDERDIHHVLGDNTRLTHYRRAHLQLTAMAALLASPTIKASMQDKNTWQQRLNEFTTNRQS